METWASFERIPENDLDLAIGDLAVISDYAPAATGFYYVWEWDEHDEKQTCPIDAVRSHETCLVIRIGTCETRALVLTSRGRRGWIHVDVLKSLR